MMACFGPLLLPPRPPPARNNPAAAATPNNNNSNNRLVARRRSSSTCRPPLPPALPPLSSTYLSFDDEVEFDEIIPKSPPVSFYEHNPPRANFSLLQRSHSEGNLRNLGTGLPVQRTFNKCIRALSGSWKNLLQGLNKPDKIEPPKGSLTPLPPRNPTLNLNNLLNAPSVTVGGMSRPPNKQPAQVKKVAPPSVPEVYRHSGSSFGSAGYSSSEDGCFLPPPDPSLRDEQHSGPGDPAYPGIQGKSPGAQFNYPAFTFPGPQQFTQLSHAKASYFHQQEDQGIDMTQSPGRDSPGSSGSGSSSGGCRHSTASLDSGRASGYLPCPTNATRSSMLDSPRCSLSSSSIGSDHATAATRVERLLKQGVPDQDAMHAWLMDLHFEEYFPLFANAGYDMAMVARMTPVDLTAIGIKKPNHRKKLKAEIAQLNIPDGLPDFIPGSLDEWLRILRLEEYGPGMAQQGYKTVEQAAQLAWEDLEETGIVKLGHQKKILLAIKRVKDIQAGKRPLPGFPHQDVLITTVGTDYSSQHECLTSSSFQTFHRMAPSLQQFQQLQLPGNATGQTWSPDRPLQGELFHMQRHQFVTTAQICSYPEFVPIKIRGARGKSLESLEGQEEQPTYSTFGATEVQIHPRPMVLAPGPGPACWRPRSYDDGDITPTNEVAMAALHEGGGTLPRPRGLAKPRPVAKVMATRPQPNNQQFCNQEIKTIPPPLSYKSLPRELTEREKYFVQFDPSCQRLPPPSPPKRFPRPGKTGDGMEHPVMSGEPTTMAAARQQLEALTLASNRQQQPHQGWDMHETELIGSLAMQQNRNGSDASFKSSSSTESDSLPFANENAGTIKQRANRPMPPNPAEFSSPKRVQKSQSVQEPSPLSYRTDEGQEPADVLNDIGNMLANLTDELDAMLEEEKRQGLGGQ